MKTAAGAWMATAIGTGLLLIAGPALADSITPTLEKGEAASQPIVHERRGGLVVGAAGGVGFAGASGYPNSARLLNNPEYYSETPLLVGYHLGGFVMGALADWLSLGPTLTMAEFSSERWKSTGFGAGLRIEAFPLVRFVPTLADLSIYGQLGVGVAELRAKGPYPTSDGAQSFFGVGVHHEWRLLHFLGTDIAGGPFVEYDSIRTTATERHWLALGFRVAFYSRGQNATQETRR